MVWGLIERAICQILCCLKSLVEFRTPKWGTHTEDAKISFFLFEIEQSS